MVYDCKEETPSNPQHHQVIVAPDGPSKPERAEEDKNDGSKAGKQARLDKHAGAQNKVSYSPGTGWRCYFP